ncbi:hypothetical protein N7676_19270 [Stenotrophomonas sp. GD03993]|uniref:hypothetical protein n=1 Tax=unclassified Stenotrophomonas TaxID=196198 RepID=UPI0018D2E47A|nr:MULTISPECIES: hypothetical protein [unclassified Stenotrophomonas]MBH1460551.1 hypothetical protein [Stenotrophomonas maltophilia]MDH0189149.1 hypothetical protein [Stenotrophomonas sp. GD04051]MDH0465947.1 hypothetical protein [Stenotrophomonas sp. GD03993]MDH0876597.1 hypothetical protein [Stenotrophomonas sp. GD03877]MDH2157357.1 hypothetical protein [Stenotrophomonas sp. GD03657]
MAWVEQNSQSDGDVVAKMDGPKTWKEKFYDRLPCIFSGLFILFLALALVPPFEGVFLRIGNLLVIGGTACIASGVILKSKLIRHAEEIVKSETRNPTRYTSREELVEVMVGLLSDLERGKTLSQVKDDLDRKWGSPEFQVQGSAIISQKNIAQAFIKSSVRTYLGSVAIIAGTLLLCAEQVIRIA